MADVANTWPLDPTPSTMIEAMTTIKSVRWNKEGHRQTIKRRKNQVSCHQISVGISSLLVTYSFTLLALNDLSCWSTKTIHDIRCIKWEQRKMPGAPMIDMGFLIKRRRPLMPAYLLRQPADHSRTTYSVPKNSTSTISCRAQCKHRARVTLIHWYRDSNCEIHTGREDVEVDKVSFLKALIM